MADRVERLRLEIDGQQVTNSFNDLSKVQRQIKKDLKGMEEGSDEYIKKSQDLNKVNKRLDEVKNKHKEVGNEWKKQTAAYKQGISDRVASTQVFGVSLGQLSSGFGLVSTGIGGTNRMLKMMKLALAATGIGALVVLLGSLITYLTSTQEGMDKVTSVTRPLSAIFQRLIGVVQELGGKVFKTLAAAINDPRQAFEDLANAIKNNVLRQFEALSLFGPAIARIFKGEILEGMKDLGNATIQMATGIENATGKLMDAANGITEFVQESAAAGTAIDKLTKQIRQQEINMTVPLAKLRVEFQKQKQLSQDRQKSEEERLAAADAAMKAQQDILDLEQSFLDKKIALMKIQQGLNDTSDADKLELQKLEAERIKFEEDATKKITSALLLRQGIEREIDADKKKQAADQSAKEKADQSAKEATAKQALEAFQRSYEEEKLLLQQQRADQLLSADEFNKEKEVLELAHLTAQLEMRKKMGQDTLDIEEELASIRITKLDEEQEKDMAVVAAKEDLQKRRAEMLSADIAANIENANSLEEATKGTLNSIRQHIKGLISEGIASAVNRALFSAPFPLNIGLGAIAAAAASNLFNKFIPSFATGGATGAGNLGFGRNSGGYIRGVVEENEFVLNPRDRQDPYVANMERYVTAKNMGLPASPPAPAALPRLPGLVQGSDSGPATSAGMDAAAAEFRAAVNVLVSQGVFAKFSPEAIDKSDKYKDKIASTKAKGL